MSRSWMPVVAFVACLSSSGVSQQQAAPRGDELVALSALETSGLEQLRAGSGELATGLSVSERDSLAQVQAQHAGLSELRAGEISDSDLKLILITAAVVVVIAILL